MKKPHTLRTTDGTPIMAVELFPCSGGMAEGFRRAGVTFTWAFDYSMVACNSYEKNLGHRPVHMDVHDLVRLVEGGWRPLPEIDLLVADPPCTPWSRAGKRAGIADPRDMLQATVKIIRLLKPHAYLIGNIPDSRSWAIVQRVIGGLSKEGYCSNDFITCDAADYGVPQHRVRPFWFGHLDGACLQPPARTHGDPALLGTLPIPGVEPLEPWVTCRQALCHLDPAELGRPVKLRYRGQNGHQHGSVPDRPARVVGTSNLSDGNVLLPGFGEPAPKTERAARHPGRKARASELDAPAGVVTTRENGDGNILTHEAPTAPRQRGGIVTSHQPSRVVASSQPRNGAAVLEISDENKRWRRPSTQDDPARAVTAGDGTNGNKMLEWPWTRPSTTVTTAGRAAPPGHHPETGSVLSQPGAIVLSELAAKILQGFPESWVFEAKTKRARWEMLGMAMPPALAEAVARAIVKARGWDKNTKKKGK